MRKITAVLVLLLPAIAACSDDESPTVPPAEKWSATLAGSNEVPPVTTNATGTATFEAVGDTAITYTVSTASITGVTMAHIHTGVAGVNGGVLVWLAPPNGTAPQAASGAVNGQLATGRFNASWIRGVGGQPAITLDSLKKLMRTGAAYVNVHTSAFGGGEVRGQIRN